MSMIHFVLQGKGGVGKSLVSSILCQFLAEKNFSVSGVDTDPVNSTLTSYKKIPVTTLNIMSGDDIDSRKFDELMEILLGDNNNDHIIVDNGAATFIPFCSYLKENDAFALINDAGHSVFLHTLVTGGQAIDDTLSGLSTLINEFSSIPIIVWLNRYFGDIVIDGKSFDQFKVYKDNTDKIHSVIEIPIKKQATYGKDLEGLFSRKETFAEAIYSEQPVMVRQRLKTFWTEMSNEIEKARIV